MPTLILALTVAVCVGILGRGYWTPDEPREADMAWRMSWQTDKAVPLLAGEAFCEKPPLAYWAAGTGIRLFGLAGWAARLPNLLYALVTALAVGLIGRRAAGPLAGLAAAAAVSTFLLSYQAAIWLATDAPLLAATALARWGLYGGFYARSPSERLRGYTVMHVALGLAFLSKSAVGWMVPVSALVTLVIWERRWRELLRWELYLGLALQAVMVLTWVWYVYVGPDGAEHLKVFFWNNLAGRFAKVDAPAELQYAAAHRNTPGKYLVEMPVYLWPWTLLVAAAAGRAWANRCSQDETRHLVRFATATCVPALAILSIAATARNIYLAPALPGVALLLGWWAKEVERTRYVWEVRAMRGTAILLTLGSIIAAAGVVFVGREAWETLPARGAFVVISAAGSIGAASFAIHAWRDAGQGLMVHSLRSLVFAYCLLLVGPASQIYREVDAWQDLGSIGRSIGRDAVGRPLVLFAPDETTRAFVDLYARSSVDLIVGPVTAQSIDRLRIALASQPRSLVVIQLPGRSGSRVSADDSIPAWAAAAALRVVKRYTLPHGRRYALLERDRELSSL